MCVYGLQSNFFLSFFTYVFVYNANAHSHSQSNSHFHSVVVHIIYFSFTDTFFYVDWQLWRCDMVLVTGAVAWSFFAIHIFYHPRLHTARAQNRRVNFSMGDSAFFLSFFLSVVLCTHNAFCDAYGLFFFSTASPLFYYCIWILFCHCSFGVNEMWHYDLLQCIYVSPSRFMCLENGFTMRRKIKTRIILLIR